MIKFLLGLIVVVFCSFCGRLFAKKYKTRQQFFTQMQEFNQRFLAEISYYRRPLEEFCQRYSYQGEFLELLQAFFQLQRHGDVFKNATLLDLTEFSFLKEAEKTFVGDYFLTLGKGDSSSQKAYFTAAETTLSRFRAECETECKKHLELYTKLGFLCGLALLIIIV